MVVASLAQGRMSLRFDSGRLHFQLQRDESGSHPCWPSGWIYPAELLPMYDYTPQFGYPISDWRRHFAWLPVDTVDAGWKWLRFVERRRIQLKSHLHGGADRWWQYRADAPGVNEPQFNELASRAVLILDGRWRAERQFEIRGLSLDKSPLPPIGSPHPCDARLVVVGEPKFVSPNVVRIDYAMA